MDTTETYIKMCEKAKKIQDIWEPKVGDRFCHLWEDGSIHLERNPVYLSDFLGRDAEPQITPWLLSWGRKIWGKQCFWLPRQDQLQEMVGDSIYNNVTNAMFSVLDDIHKFAFSSEFLDYIPLTMEQLWLAFVMKERYNKVWNGENWVKND